MKTKVLILLITVIIIVIATIFIFQPHQPKSSNRIEVLESRYNISFSNTDVKVSNTTMGQDINERLQFHVDDYHLFMENQYYGEVVTFSESDDRSSAQYKCKPYPNSVDSLQNRLTFKIQFNSNNSGYDGVLTSYYE